MTNKATERLYWSVMFMESGDTYSEQEVVSLRRRLISVSDDFMRSQKETTEWWTDE